MPLKHFLSKTTIQESVSPEPACKSQWHCGPRRVGRSILSRMWQHCLHGPNFLGMKDAILRGHRVLCHSSRELLKLDSMQQNVDNMQYVQTICSRMQTVYSRIQTVCSKKYTICSSLQTICSRCRQYVVGCRQYVVGCRQYVEFLQQGPKR